MRRGIHLLRLRLLPERGGSRRGFVVAVCRPAVREIHEREEIVPSVVVVLFAGIRGGIVEQLVIQGLAVAAAADEVARERALEEAAGRHLAAQGEFYLRDLGGHRVEAGIQVATIERTNGRALTDARSASTRPTRVRSARGSWLCRLRREWEETKHNTRRILPQHPNVTCPFKSASTR